MKKNKQRSQQKAQLKANRKQAQKAVKAALVADLTTLISTFAEPNKKLKKLVEKAATAFSKEIDKTAKPVIEAPEAKAQVTTTVEAEKKVNKSRIVKKTDQEATK